MKKAMPNPNPTATQTASGRSSSHRVWWRYQLTANTSATSNNGSEAPAIRRPSTIDATSGTGEQAGARDRGFREADDEGGDRSDDDRLRREHDGRL